MYHWYEGVVPPLVGMAVKSTEVPSQTGLASAEMLTLAVRIGLTVMVTEFEVAGEPAKQGAALEVITTEITSPLTGMYE